jgi:hypothetical protein
MNKKLAVVLRDSFNFILFFIILLIIAFYVYNVPSELINLKNVIFPFKAAIFLCIIVSVTLVFLNRITTFIAIKLMKNG